MRRLYWYATVVVLAHAAVVFWHLELLARLNTALKVDQVPLLAGLANIIPLLALISLWARLPKLGGWLLLFLAVPLAIGGYSISSVLVRTTSSAWRRVNGPPAFASARCCSGCWSFAVAGWALRFCAARRCPSQVRN